MIQIKRAAEITGVPEATLRIWERRYGLGATHRSESGYRLYDSESIMAIKEMQKLIDDGYPANEAAREVKAKLHDLQSRNIKSPTSKKVTEQLNARFFKAIKDLNSQELTQILDEVFSQSSFEYAVDEWLVDILKELGRLWQEGEMDIASEHFASHAIMRRISTAYEGAGESKTGPRVIIGAPTGSAHEIGSLAFATTARRNGLRVIYLGVDVPAESWVDAAKRHHANAVVISAKMPSDVAVVEDCINALRSQCPQVKIAVGGSAAQLVKNSDLVLTGNLTNSTELLIGSLHK